MYFAPIYERDLALLKRITAADGSESLSELCRSFSVLTIVREELFYPAYVDIERALVDDLIARMDLMRVIVGELEDGSPVGSAAVLGWLHCWRTLWRFHLDIEHGPGGLLSRLAASPFATNVDEMLRERLTGLDRLQNLPCPEPASIERRRSFQPPVGRRSRTWKGMTGR